MAMRPLLSVVLVLSWPGAHNDLGRHRAGVWEGGGLRVFADVRLVPARETLGPLKVPLP